MKRRRKTLAALCICLLSAGYAPAEEKPESLEEALEEVVVVGEKPVSAASSRTVREQDFELRPKKTPSDILRLVPNLFIAQHAGGGKGDQIFLRGFDNDHGTDVAIFIDDIPVNMRSHAHGQGYADLHFLIPEVLKTVEVYKGPYFTEYGDFATGGAVQLVTRDVFEENSLKVNGGYFDTTEVLFLLSPTKERLKTMFAFNYFFTNGPFFKDQKFDRYHFFTKASLELDPKQRLSLWASGYEGDWNASGQIPRREVKAGRLNWFGAIDPTEGGDSSRYNFNLLYRYDISKTQKLKFGAWASYYDLGLFSNFTFFLNDPVRGDGIEQRDKRWLYGTNFQYQSHLGLFGIPGSMTFGFDTRFDHPEVLLAQQVKRDPFEKITDTELDEFSLSPYLKFEVFLADWLHFVGGARGDYFSYDVDDRLKGGAGGTLDDVIDSYKANLIFGPWRHTEFYLNFGTGFHSNDARAVVTDSSLESLPRAYGYEVGVRSKWLDRIDMALSLWTLRLESELVLVGDEGTVEPRGTTRRWGLEVELRYKISDWLWLSSDFSWTEAHFLKGNDAVPFAPRLVHQTDVTVRLPWGLEGGLELRHLGRRYASEDRSWNASGYTQFDLQLKYRWKNLEAFITLLNMADRKFPEAQHFFESRLPGEPGPVADIHVSPGTSRTVYGGIAFRF